MKGDFSRLTFDKTKHFSAVLKQQGRVDVDADWNELQAIQRHRMETEAADVIGCCGAPSRSSGFNITTDGNTLSVSKGRIYIDGILCENENDCTILDQPDLPSSGVTIPDIATPAIVYLDVWQRHLTALDDLSIRESALGGPDTATRLKTIWQVKVLAVSLATNSPVIGISDPHIAGISSGLAKMAKKMNPRTHGKLLKVLKENNARLKLITGGPAGNLVPTVTAVMANLKAAKFPATVKKEMHPLLDMLTATKDAMAANPQNDPCRAEYEEWSTLIKPSSGTLMAHTADPEDSDDPCCTIPPAAGYRGSENQLYRVEIHQGSLDENGNAISPTFKWSRDNGSVVTAIVGDIQNQNTIPVHDLGPDGVLGFAVGQWVEVLDDICELNGQPGSLAQITDIDPDSKQITVKQPVTLAYQKGVYHPKVRRWDQIGDSNIAGGVAISPNTWIPLESGVEVQFSNGTYRTGDYWLIPARTATGAIEWPVDSAGKPSPQPPLGIKHHYCRLALVEIDVAYNDGQRTVQFDIKEDCRCQFPSLCALRSSPAEEPSIQIQSVAPIEGKFQTQPFRLSPAILANGLAITCTADSSVNSSTDFFAFRPQPACSVTLYLPYDFQGDDGTMKLFGRRVIGYQPFVLDADVTTKGNLIFWKPPLKTTAPWLGGSLTELFRTSGLKGVLACLTLKGNFIWSSSDTKTLYLDGDAFGDPSSRGDLNVVMPSGDSHRGGDFEMWFWLAG